METLIELITKDLSLQNENKILRKNLINEKKELDEISFLFEQKKTADIKSPFMKILSSEKSSHEKFSYENSSYNNHMIYPAEQSFPTTISVNQMHLCVFECVPEAYSSISCPASTGQKSMLMWAPRDSFASWSMT